MHGRIEFCFLFDTRSHEAAGVECDQDRLIAPDLILPRSKFSATRSRCPRDVSQLIATNVVAHRFEFAALTASGSFAMRRNKRASAERLQFRFPGASHVWINLDRHRLSNIDLVPDQPEARTKAQRSLSKLKPASSWWFNSVDERRGALCFNVNASFALTGQNHLRRIFVFNAQQEGSIGSVLNVNSYFGFRSHGEATAELA